MGRFQIEHQITTDIDTNSRSAILKQQIKLADGSGTAQKFQEQFAHQLWTIEQLTTEAEETGFKVQTVRCRQQPELPANHSAARLWFVLMKRKK